MGKHEVKAVKIHVTGVTHFKTGTSRPSNLKFCFKKIKIGIKLDKDITFNISHVYQWHSKARQPCFIILKYHVFPSSR